MNEIGIGFRLMPIGPVVAQERDGVIFFVAHDVVWDAVRLKRPDFPVRYLSRMIGNPAFADEYGLLVAAAFELAEFAAEWTANGAIDFDRLIAGMEYAADKRASGQTSLFG